jgi:hypothetical protein
MITYDDKEKMSQPKKSGILFITFALGFLAVLSSGYAVLTALQINELAIQNSAAAISAQARSSQGISQQLPVDLMAETTSVGVMSDKLIVAPNTKPAR